MTKDEALKLALEALESSRVFVTTREKIKHPEGAEWYDQIITAIKEALAEPEQHQDWCASLTQMLMSMPPKPAPCNCKPKPKPEQEPCCYGGIAHDCHAGEGCRIVKRMKAAPKPEQKPVAWGVFEGNLHDIFFTKAEAVEMAQLKGAHAEVKPLYTAPQRTWVGLTDGEVDKMILLMGFPPDWITENAIVKNIVRNLEAKLKELNL